MLEAPPITAATAKRSFAALHRDLWRVIARAPGPLMLGPLAIVFVDNLVHDLGGPQINPLGTLLYVYCFWMILKAVRNLANSKRMDKAPDPAPATTPTGYTDLMTVYLSGWVRIMVAFLAICYLLALSYFVRINFSQPILIVIPLSIVLLAVDTWLRLSFSGPVVVFENLRSNAAIRRSITYVKGNRTHLGLYTLGLYLLYFPITIAPVIFAKQPHFIKNPFIQSLALLPFAVLFISLSTIFNALMYLDCATARDPQLAAAVPAGPPTAAQRDQTPSSGRGWLLLTALLSLGSLIAAMVAQK
jgi:hypothetical protein